jgi:hypothetical protein
VSLEATNLRFWFSRPDLEKTARSVREPGAIAMAHADIVTIRGD